MTSSKLPQHPHPDESSDDVERETVLLDAGRVGECSSGVGGGSEEGGGEGAEGVGLDERREGGKGEEEEKRRGGRRRRRGKVSSDERKESLRGERVVGRRDERCCLVESFDVLHRSRCLL